jgi:hypothetical protein
VAFEETHRMSDAEHLHLFYILDSNAQLRAVTQCPCDFVSLVSHQDEDFPDSQRSHGFDLMKNKRSITNRQERFGVSVAERLHPRSAPGSQYRTDIFVRAQVVTSDHSSLDVRTAIPSPNMKTTTKSHVCP